MMTATITIQHRRDPKSGHHFRAVYLGREHIASFWHLPAALDCAKRLAEICGAKLASAEIIPFPKEVA